MALHPRLTTGSPLLRGLLFSSALCDQADEKALSLDAEPRGLVGLIPFSGSVVRLWRIRSFAPPPYDGFAFVTGD